MKVLQVIDTLNVGGAERVCIDISNLLNQKNIDTTVLTISKKGKLATLLNPDIKVINLNRKSKYDLKAARKTASILRNFDIIHVHMRYTYRYVKLISIVFNLKMKILFHDHFGKIKVDKSIPKLMNSILKPTFYIGVSEELIDWAKEKVNLKSNQTFLLKNIVIKKKQLKRIKSKSVILVSNISPVKNQLFAIQLIEKTNLNLTIYGNINDSKYFSELKTYIYDNKLEDRIKFIHNEIDIQSVLHNYAFAIQTSKSESGPLVLIEFLAQSLPFIAYETGEVANTIKNELPFFIDNFNINNWIQKINEINNVSSENIINTYYKYFNPENYIKKCLKIYKEVLNY